MEREQDLCLLFLASPQPNPNSGNLMTSRAAAWAGDRLATSQPCWSHDSIDKFIVPAGHRAALGGWDSKRQDGKWRSPEASWWELDQYLHIPTCHSSQPFGQDRDLLWSLTQTGPSFNRHRRVSDPSFRTLRKETIPQFFSVLDGPTGLEHIRVGSLGVVSGRPWKQWGGALDRIQSI